MALSILTDKVAKVSAQAHVGRGRLFDPPFIDGEASEEDEPAAVDDGGARFGQQVGEKRGKRECFLKTHWGMEPHPQA